MFPPSSATTADCACTEGSDSTEPPSACRQIGSLVTSPCSRAMLWEKRGKAVNSKNMTLNKKHIPIIIIHALKQKRNYPKKDKYYCNTGNSLKQNYIYNIAVLNFNNISADKPEKLPCIFMHNRRVG